MICVICQTCTVCRQLGRHVTMVYNNLDWARAALSLERAISVGFATRYMQLAKVTGQEAGWHHCSGCLCC